MEQKCANCANGKWRDGVTPITETCIKCHYVDKGALEPQPSNWIPKELTNADRIRAMSDEELAEFIRLMVDDDCVHDVACYGCINYGTHHSNPDNKGTHLYECEGCPNEGIGLDITKWLKLPAEVTDNEKA